MADPEFERDRRLTRLDTHLRKIYELACRGNIPAARVVIDDDLGSDLDWIQQAFDELWAEGDVTATPGSDHPS